MKNEALEVLYNRRSIRKFKPEQIKDEELDLVLKAGTYAPTAKGTQSPLIVVVQNPDDVKLLDRLSFQIMMKSLGLNRDGTAYYGAPTIILVFATDRAMNEETGIIDAANATTNMVNAAYAVGLGSCWIHRAKEIFESAEGKALLNINKTYHTSVKGDLIFLTCGAAASLAIVTKAFVKPGEEVITFAPHFPEYRTYTEAVGGILVNVNPDQDFFPDFSDLERKITGKTRLVIYDSPNNPTGAFYTEEVIKKMASVLSKKEKEYGHPIYLVSDEPYRELLYKGEEYPFVTNYYDNSIVCYSFSKCLSLPGERIGYILVNPKCENVRDVYAVICGSASMLGYICAPALFQHMVSYVLGYTSNLDEYKKNKEALCAALKEIGFEVVEPTGAFYLFMKALEPDAEKFSEVAKQFELLLVPSDPFDYKGYVRIAYCVSYEQIVNSIPAFKKLYYYYKNRQ